MKRGYDLFPVGTPVTDLTGMWFEGVKLVSPGHTSPGWVIVEVSEESRVGMEDHELSPANTPSLEEVM